MILLILLTSVGLSFFMTLAWAFQKKVGNAGWVDVFWTFGLGLAGLAVALLPFSGAPSPRQWLVAGLVAIWSLRLGIHLFDRVSHSPEDVRYAHFRKEWGKNYQARMFVFLQIQALAAIFLAGSVLLAAHNPSPGLRLVDWAGAAILAIAIIGEGVGDYQLRQFKSIKANKGRVCDAGLWAWSRHPNYFFEWFGWLAYPLMAIDLSAHYPFGWAALSAPVLMYWLLAHVSGVPPLEIQMLRTRGDAYRAYQSKTSVFFPWPPIKDIPVMTMIESATRVFERLALPDTVTTLGINYLVDRTRRSLSRFDEEREKIFLREMMIRPIAEYADEANEQHYEIPPEFFGLILGPRRKYSCCLYWSPADTLATAEDHALAETAAHADLADGQDILELGCGWGSLSLWMAEHYPNARITSVSNSNGQRAYIEAEAAARGFRNLRVITCDMNDFMPETQFDRVVSVEMFEHMANWKPLLERVRCALRHNGRLFLHVFSHRNAPYRFNRENKADWIAQHFFTGGIMPSHNLIRNFGNLFEVEAEWSWNGVNYQRTAYQWLENYDRHADEIAAILKRVYGADWILWRRRWRLFFLATAGLFGNNGGKEWGVSHYRLSPA